jgi:GWxTD domain-containing protein
MYAAETLSVELQATVTTADGRAVTSSAPETMSIGVGGGVAARSFDLAGLPEGAYALRLTVRYPDGPVVRDAPFTMTGFETEAHIAEAVATPTTDYFSEATEATLDTLYGPLQYVMASEESGIYQDLSLEGKRNFMRTFWAKRDPTAGTPENEALVAYYRLFYEANRRFRESGAGNVEGWRTDRGRIFLKYGEPEETLRRPVAGITPPYEVWKYTRPRQLKFVFLDHTGLGNYQLIYTNDRFEPSRADWTALLGAEAVQDVERF